MDYSEELVVAINKEIELLSGSKARIESAIEDLRALLNVGEAPEVAAKTQPKRKYVKKVQAYHLPLLNNAQIKDKEVSEQVLRRREYQNARSARLREAKKGHFNGGGVGQPLKATSRFSLDREFDLYDKEIALMRSYLNTWKATGRLEEDEIRALESHSMKSMASLGTLERTQIRDIFYACRGRVMDKTKKLSSVE